MSLTGSALGTRARRAALALLVVLASWAGLTAPASAAPVYRFYAIGDSVMIDASSSLHHSLPSIAINAAVSRQVSDGIAILQQKHANHTVAGTTIFGLGTNGTLTSGQMTQLINLTATHRLVMLTVHCGYCSWTPGNNRTIRSMCTKAHHCYLADFQYHALYHPEWFTGDGVHMPSGGAGAKAYAHYTWLACRAAHSWAY